LRLIRLAASKSSRNGLRKDFLVSGDDISEVMLLGDSVARLVLALARFDVPEMPAFTLIGGLAVLARLGRTHRATTDLDTATAGAERDQLLQILELTGPGITPGRHGEHNRLYIDGVKVDVIATAPISDEDFTDFTDSEALFLVSHRWAVETTEKLRIRGDGRASAVVPVAVPAALVAMKLHAIEDRREVRPEKVASTKSPPGPTKIWPPTSPVSWKNDAVTPQTTSTARWCKPRLLKMDILVGRPEGACRRGAPSGSCRLAD
jgi:hypothetical protein